MTKSDRLTAIFFCICFVELGFAYAPLSKISFLVDLSACLGEFIPALRFPVTTEAKVYMATTLLILPIKMWLVFVAEWEERRFFSFMPLPFADERITPRMVLCMIALLVINMPSVYFTIGYGIDDYPHRGFLRGNYGAFDIWFGWVIYRLVALGYILTMNIFAIKVWVKRFERNK